MSNPPSRDARRALVEELERRLLFSADPLSAALDPALADLDAGSSPPAEIELVAQSDPASEVAVLRREIVFVDGSVEGADALIAELRAGAAADRSLEVYLLDAEGDGIQEIGEILAGRQDVDAVHIISHGTTGAVRLGSTWLSSDTLAAHADVLSGWGESLSNM